MMSKPARQGANGGVAVAGVAMERGWGEKYAFVILAVLLLLVVPLSLDVFRLGLAAKYL